RRAYTFWTAALTKIVSNLAKLPASAARTVAMRVVALAPPPWAQELAGPVTGAAVPLARIDGEHFALISARVLGAAKMEPSEVEEQSFQAYLAIAEEL